MQTDNPMGTDGFEFVEFTAPDAAALGKVFESIVLHAEAADPSGLVVSSATVSPRLVASSHAAYSRL